MPNKTIYVSSENEALFDKAKKIEGRNLSAVITKALKNVVDDHDMAEQEFERITVNVGNNRQKRFFGKKIVSSWAGPWINSPKDDWRGVRVYETPKHQFAVEIMRIIHPLMLFGGSAMEQALALDENPEAQSKFGDLLLKYENGDFDEYAFGSELVVFPDIKSMQGQVPESLISQLNELYFFDGSEIEDLDI